MKSPVSTPHDRLRDARLAAGFKSMSAAASALGVTSSTYRAHENGQNDFDTEQAENYARKFRVSASYLLLGIDKDNRELQRISEEELGEVTPFVPSGEYPGVSTIRAYQGSTPGASPDIDVSAGAGPGGLPLPAVLPHGGVIFSSESVRGEIVLPEYLLSEFTRTAAERVHWIKVRGDSMEPSLLPGDRVMVDTTDTSIAQGGIFVLRDPDGEIIVKRLHKLAGGIVDLISDNPKQGDRQVELSEIAVIGRVVGRLSRI